VPVIARELGVRYVLEGSVRRSGSSLRVTAQLIDAASDAHVWAEKYAGTIEDVFDLQEVLSRKIVDALRVALTPDEDRRLGARAISDLRAFECYLRARQLHWSGTGEAIDLALRLTREALGIVGENAVLRALEGTLHFQYVNFGISRDPAHLEAAERCARAAVALAPEAADGHLLFGVIAYNHGRMAQAVRYLRRALELEPSHADSLGWASYIRLQTGQVAAARASVVRLLDVDPFNAVSHQMRGMVEYHEGAPERAVPHLDRALELDPRNALVHYIRAEVLASAGRYPEAIAGLRALREITPGPALATTAAFLECAVAGDRAGAAVAVEECRPHALDDEQFSVGVALGFTLLGDRETALDWLENAVRRGFVSYPFLAESGPFARPLRGEPRFEALMERVRREWEAFDS
jgi:tetratricopeptide (TPR) repeat protein